MTLSSINCVFYSIIDTDDQVYNSHIGLVFPEYTYYLYLFDLEVTFSSMVKDVVHANVYFENKANGFVFDENHAWNIERISMDGHH